MSASEAIELDSATPGPFAIKGGRYLFGVTATFGGGSVALQGLLPDQVTFATVPDITGTALSATVAGWKVVDLSPGQYKILITTATAVLSRLASIPY